MKASGRGIFEGTHAAYPRALYRAMGYQDSDFDRPLIGIVNSWDELNPGHFHLCSLAERMKQGVREAGGAPAEFNTVAPCDGIAQAMVVGALDAHQTTQEDAPILVAEEADHETDSSCNGWLWAHLRPAPDGLPWARGCPYHGRLRYQ